MGNNRTAFLSGRAALLATALLAGLALTERAQAIEGCQSDELLARFVEFGKTGRMPPDLGAFLFDSAKQKVEPYQAFDKTYFVGVCWVSAWLLKGPEGLVLIDTLHEPHVDTLLANIRALGFDPRDIRYVFMTHGHFDHVGGAKKLKELVDARFIMTQEGWNEAQAAAAASAGKPGAWGMIAPDIVVKDGDVVHAAGIPIRVYETPGHTYGTASFAFDVSDGKRNYHAFTVGGLGLNAIKGPEQVEAFISSVRRIRGMVKDASEPITVHLTTHPFANGLTEAAARLQARDPRAPNPLVDPESFLHQLDSLEQGALERLAVEREKQNPR